ncbi:hypothetical protein PQD71_gp057 [Kosakonia phage Kc263]|uniref:Uncharacterized protein n=1 Tax=Kosakonia phage Kc263 TaxID=2863194 RepID=A0AAE7WFK0_9CAUD|nr:hypothetical protein PQD71_gp057 [Kosakonia phage Kc263]QYN79950.1 hypothetical protein [Kosakonia phage Kc263]
MHPGEVEHFATMVSGCEDLNNGLASSDAVYAKAVLKNYAGMEGNWLGGFTNAVKSWTNNPLNLIPALAKGQAEINGELQPAAQSVMEMALYDLMNDFSKVDKSIANKAKSIAKSLDNNNWDNNVFVKECSNLMKSINGLVQTEIKRVNKKNGNKEAVKEINHLIQAGSRFSSAFNKYGSKSRGIINKWFEKRKK